MNKLRTIIISAALVFSSAVALMPAAASVSALDPSDAVTDGIDAAGGKKQKGLPESIKIIVNVMLFLIGAVAVIMIVIGGIRYTLSNGDSSQITAAKNTIMYAVIGLVVALLAYAIVNFVVDQF